MRKPDNKPTATVEAISRINFSGNIIPNIWFQTIVYKDKKGTRPYLEAIVILADFVYWYRKSEIRDERTGEVIGYKRRFAADKLQRKYEAIAEQFGLSYKTAREAVKFLEGIGVLTIELRNVKTDTGTLQNVMYLEVVPAVLVSLTFPKSVTTRCPNGKSVITDLGGIYTEITPEITNKENNYKVGANSANAKLDPDRVLFSGEIKEPILEYDFEEDTNGGKSLIPDEPIEVKNHFLKSVSENEHTKAPQPPAAEPTETPPQIQEPYPTKTHENCEVEQSVNSKEKTAPRANKQAKTKSYEFSEGELKGTPFELERWHNLFWQLFRDWRKEASLSAPAKNLNTFRKILDIDGRTPDQVRAVYWYLKERGRAINDDGRFLTEIESIEKLRKNFEVAEKQMSQRKGLKPLPKTIQPPLTKTYPTYDPFA